MGGKTKIEWTDASWTPIRAYWHDHVTQRVGWHCEHVSEGCRNCYAEGMNKRLGTGLDFKPGHRKDVVLALDEKILTQPLRWRTPRRIFVCSMTDLFADFVKDEWIDRMFAVMALCPQHTFQILTKRPERMRAYFANEEQAARIAELDFVRKAIHDADCDDPDNATEAQLRRLSATDDARPWLESYTPWEEPLPNVWLGTSCEDQAAADARIPHLLATPAAIRFLSCEPLLGPIDLARWIHQIPAANDGDRTGHDGGLFTLIDWVITGGESGREARPIHPDWPRSLRDQCATAAVPFFFKQWGEWGPDEGPLDDGSDPVMEGRRRCAWFNDGKWHFEKDGYAVDLEASKGSGQWVYRLGKEIAGRTLDGKIHDAYPEVA